MTALMRVRSPDEKHRCLKVRWPNAVAPRLIDEMTAVMLAEFDAETRFRLRAARGAGPEALGPQLLDKAMGQ